MSLAPKKYGLQLSAKSSEKSSVCNAFTNDDSDDNEEGVTDWIKNTLQIKKKQTRLDIEKALKDDPTVYQYDELYDDMQKKKEENIQLKKKTEERKPRYIQLLLAQAERRKKDNERRIERQIQKDRDAEGDEFEDKESFITPSYMKKLEEMRKLDDEERRRDMLEEIGDVSKQRDMTGFYRHLYRTVVSEEGPKKDSDSNCEKKSFTSEERQKISRRHKDDSLLSCDSDNSINHYTNKKQNQSGRTSNKVSRQYRKQKQGSSSDESESSDVQTSMKNVDSFSQKVSKRYRNNKNESSSDEDNNDRHKSKKKSIKQNPIDKPSSDDNEFESSRQRKVKKSTKQNSGNESSSDESELINSDKIEENLDSDTSLSSSSSSDDDDIKKRNNEVPVISNKTSNSVCTKENENQSATVSPLAEIKKQPQKISIWEKRTVGEVFEAALQRYFKRKSNKISAGS